MLEIFFSHMPSHPLKNKMVRPYHEAETRQCYLSHTVSAFAFSIISYRHAAHNVFIQFYGNSFAETVCKPFWNLIVTGKISLDFVAKTLTKNLNESLQANSASEFCKREL